jgi:hypothetical protein
LLGALAWLAASARYVPPDPPVNLAPPAVAKAEKSVEIAVREVRKARRDTVAGRARFYRIAVRQDDLNTLLRADARAKRLLKRHQVARPALEIKDGRLKAGALVTFRGQRVYVTAEGPVAPGEGGQLLFRPEKVWLGKVRAPQTVTEEIARYAAEAFQNGALQLPGRVKAVRLEGGHLVIEGDTKG